MAEPPPLPPEPPPIAVHQIATEYSDDLLMRFYKRTYFRAYGISSIVMLGCLILFTWENGPWVVLAICLLALLSLFILALLGMKRSFRRTDALITKLPHRHVEFCFDEAGVTHSSAIGSTRLEWRMLAKLRRWKDIWGLYLTSQQAWLLPVDGMSPELQEFIIRKCAENGVKVK